MEEIVKMILLWFGVGLFYTWMVGVLVGLAVFGFVFFYSYYTLAFVLFAIYLVKKSNKYSTAKAVQNFSRM